MLFKDNVTITFTTTIQTIMRAFERACNEVVGASYQPTCTSGLEGTHSLESGHYHGRAVDFRKQTIPAMLIPMVLERTRTILGADYLVLEEPDHIHIQRQKNSF